MNEDEREKNSISGEENADEWLPLREVAIRAAEIVCGLPDLEISDRQQNHVTILQKILDEEKSGRVVRRRNPNDRRAHYFSAWIRIGLAACLFSAVFFSLLHGGFLFPARLPGGPVKEIQDLINKIKPEDVVFVAFDYEPGYAGEVEGASAPILKKLVDREAALVVLSTLPSGTLMAERSFQRMNSPDRSNVFQMGYVPGNQAGLSSLVQSPRGTLPETLDGRSLWDAGPLQNVRQMDDLALVLLLVSDGQTARYWMEQVLPNLGKTPLIVVSSEQIAPLLLPYQDSRPFLLVSGRAGASALRAALDKKSKQGGGWDAYQFGILISLVVLILGLVYALLPERIRQAQRGVVEK